MTQLPVIVGFGGYNAAGRTSFHHGFRRMIIESLDAETRQETLAGLAVMTGLINADASGFKTPDGAALTLAEVESRYGDAVLDATLIRRIEPRYFDVDNTPWHQSVTVAPLDNQSQFLLSRKQLPQPVPSSWEVQDHSATHVKIILHDNLDIKLNAVRDFPVKAAGQLPTGFDPAALYDARFHPRGLQLSILGISDALNAMGIPWNQIQDAVTPEQIAVFAGSMLGQMDDYGYGGMLQSRLKGNRTTAKQLPLGMNTMVADFINAYVLGHVGTTGAATGACATFLYNLRMGIEEIKQGRARVVIVGNSEAPITPEVIEGFGAMSALCTHDSLKKLTGTDTPDYRKSSRPFGENCGFTIGESCQFLILMDDALALELGAQIHGAITDVFINADGFKKSISAPGPGNYLTLARAVAAARMLVGDEGIQQHSFVHAHGSSTPANRTTESALFDRVAGAFGIENWPVTAVKAYVGHSLGPASGDQIMSALGSFQYGIVPGIKTITAVADDVERKHLTIPVQDLDAAARGLDVAFINSKGFGGNNATGVVVSPRVVEKMLAKRYDADTLNNFRLRQQLTQARAARYDQAALQGQLDVQYHFGENMIDDQALMISREQIQVPGFAAPITLNGANPFADMVD